MLKTCCFYTVCVTMSSNDVIDVIDAVADTSLFIYLQVERTDLNST